MLTRELKLTNGIVFSPNEQYLYVPAAKAATHYPVRSDGTLGKGMVLIDLTQPIPGDEAVDAMHADDRAKLYLSAPGGMDL